MNEVDIPFANTSNSTYLAVPQEELWAVVQEVAEVDSTGYNDGGPSWYCPFCSGYQTDASRLHRESFPHQRECIVPRARTLVERRKQQVHMTVTVTKEGA